MNKLYLQRFPESVRPRTLITRNRAKLKRFVESEGTVVLKPLQGSGGQNVFMVRSNDLPNINQIIGAVSRDGYVIAQEYLNAAAQGDTRLFLMNGVPLQYQGNYAAFRRIRTGEDMRSNISSGGRLRRARLSDSDLQLAATVRPQLVKDGMFLVGLDIVGDRLMEINVFSPGGLGSAQIFEKVDFSECVVDALEQKAHYKTTYRGNLENLNLALL
jgi:glutathione synthase